MINKSHLIREKILNSETYKSLSFVQKATLTKKNNIKIIEHDLNVIKNITFENWEKKYQTTYLNKLIIKELCNE